MEVIGFIFGLAGISIAIKTRGQMEVLRKEFDLVKKQLEEADAVK